MPPAAPPPTSPARARPAAGRTARLGRAAYAAAGAALVALALSVPALYLVDLPAWTYQGALLAREWADPEATPWALWAHPVPNTLATLAPALLLPVAGPVWAGKLVAAGLLTAGFGAAWALARAADPGAPWARAAVLASTLVVSSSFWNGYLGFQIGVTLAIAVGAAWLRRGRLPAPALAAASVALFFAHAIPFGAFALGAGLDALRRRDGRQLAALTPAGALTAWYVAARLAGPAGEFEAAWGAGGPLRALAYKGYTALKLGPFQHPDGLDGAGVLAGAPALYWLGVGLAGAFVLALVAGLAVGTARLRPGGRRWAAAYGWALVGAALVLPPFALNVVNPGERVLVVAAAALVAVVPLDRRLLTALGAAALVFVADDAAALWAQRAGLPADARTAVYAERAAREAAAPPAARTFDDAVDDAGAEALPLLGHPVLLHSDLYDAVRRRDWARASFDSGLLRPPGR